MGAGIAYAAPKLFDSIESRRASTDAALSYYPCVQPPSDSAENMLKQAAETCLSDMQSPVALIGFGIQPDVLESIRISSEGAIIDGFDGTVDPSIDAITASPEAARVFFDENHDCVDKNNMESNASKIADGMMNLSNYKHIIGITSLQACQLVGGIANLTEERRYIDVYHAPSGSSQETNYNDILRAASSTAHEFGHGVLGLGHAGTANIPVSLRPGVELDSVKPPLEYVDILNEMSKTPYDEYGNGLNVMGGPERTSLDLNRFQRRKILWPQEVLGDVNDTMQLINNTTVYFDRSENSADNFAALHLDSPIIGSFIGIDGKEQKQMFDYLVIDPRCSDDGIPVQAQVYLANKDSAESVNIMPLYADYYPDDRPLRRSFVIGDQSVDVTVTKRSITVTDASER